MGQPKSTQSIELKLEVRVESINVSLESFHSIEVDAELKLLEQFQPLFGFLLSHI